MIACCSVKNKQKWNSLDTHLLEWENIKIKALKWIICVNIWVFHDDLMYSEPFYFYQNDLLLLFSLSSTFSSSSSPLRLSCKNNPATVKTYRLSSNKNISPSEEQWDELKTKGSEEWRALGLFCVFGFGIFSTDEALRPETCWCPEVAFVSCRRRWARCSRQELWLFVFLDGKRHQQRLWMSRMFAGKVSDSFPGRRDGTVKILAARIHTSPP